MGKERQNPELDELMASIRRAIHDEDRAALESPSASAAALRPVPARGVPDDIRALREKINQELSKAGGTASDSDQPARPEARAKPFSTLFRQPVPVSQPVSVARSAPRAPMAPAKPKGAMEIREFAPLPKGPVPPVPGAPLPVSVARPVRAAGADAAPQIAQRAFDQALMTAQAEQAAQMASEAFKQLAHPALGRPELERGFEQIAREMLQPMLRQWLDNHLPALVERLVREEIERVARRGR